MTSFMNTVMAQQQEDVNAGNSNFIEIAVEKLHWFSGSQDPQRLDWFRSEMETQQQQTQQQTQQTDED